jgi:hypothetical protein
VDDVSLAVASGEAVAVIGPALIDDVLNGPTVIVTSPSPVAAIDGAS